MIKYSKFGIHIKVSDFFKSLDFYTKLGLKPIFAFGDKGFLNILDKRIPTAKENYRGITFEVGGSLLEIADGHIAVKPEVFKQRITNSKVSAMLDVESVDEVVKTCKDNEFEIAVDPKVFPWGSREVVVRDPDGFILVFREFVKQGS